MSDNGHLTVSQALSAVMGDVQSIGKDQTNQQQNYSFRGVDAVVNAVGPALRKHGVVVVPTSVEYEAEKYQTSRGTTMRGVTALVSFRFYGPAGDFIDARVAGESSDSGDKAIPKAHSVAYRTLLLQALCIPTNEPDSDSFSHERAAPPTVDHEAILALEDELIGLVPSVRQAVTDHRARSTPEGHEIWLRRCIDKARDDGDDKRAAASGEAAAPSSGENPEAANPPPLARSSQPVTAAADTESGVQPFSPGSSSAPDVTVEVSTFPPDVYHADSVTGEPPPTDAEKTFPGGDFKEHAKPWLMDDDHRQMLFKVHGWDHTVFEKWDAIRLDAESAKNLIREEDELDMLLLWGDREARTRGRKGVLDVAKKRKEQLEARANKGRTGYMKAEPPKEDFGELPETLQAVAPHIRLRAFLALVRDKPEIVDNPAAWTAGGVVKGAQQLGWRNPDGGPIALLADLTDDDVLTVWGAVPEQARTAVEALAYDDQVALSEGLMA